MFGTKSSIEFVAADIEESGSLGLVPLAPFQSDIKHPTGGHFHGERVGAECKVIGYRAAARQTGINIRFDDASNSAGADAEVLGLDQAVTDDGGALQTVAKFPDVAGPSIGNQFINGFLRNT